MVDDGTPVQPGPEAAPKAPTGRWTRIALIVSLGLNLAVAGVVVGAAFRHMPGGHMVRDVGFGPFTEALSPDDQDALRRRFIAQTRDIAGNRRAAREDAAALLAAIRAEPFDPASVLTALDQIQLRTRERQATGRALLGAYIAEMPAEARHAFADRLETILTRRPDRRGDDKRDGDRRGTD
jgi:uncharacterized membrane protein